MTKKNIIDFQRMKERGEKIAYITSYDAQMAHFVEKAGIDMILVGDSLGNTDLGYSSTLPVTMEEMIIHTRAVRRGAPNTFIVGDMPFMSYQPSIEDAIRNAGRFIKETECDAVKLEGGVNMANRVKAIADAGILVMGHIGLAPQFAAQQGGWKAQGRSAKKALEIVRDAIALEEAGAFAILIEGVPAPVSKAITEICKIPILGIGAGQPCDGQLLIIYDMLGIFQHFTPKFVKKYGNLGEEIVKCLKEYKEDVVTRKFPGEEHCYRMPEEEVTAFEQLFERKINQGR